jgi:LacI family transcriptional regulator
MSLGALPGFQTHQEYPVIADPAQWSGCLSDLTLDDIAKQAGVSRSTVSRVINGQPYVRQDVRERVLQVIQVTGFHPNIAARTLAMQRSWMIGLLLPRTVSSFFVDPYFPRLTQGVAQACNQHNFTLGLFLVGTPEDEEKIFPRVSRRGFLDGILVQTGQIGDQLIDRLVNTNLPLVVAGRPFHTNDVSYIDVDNVKAASDAVIHLIHLGYKRFGTITGTINSTAGIDRLEGYRHAILEQGWRIDENLIAEGDFTEKGGYTAMQCLLAAKPEAVFSASDAMAIGAIRAVHEAGLHVPQDVAFIGFDDLPFASQHEIKLTTVRQPIVQFGARAVETLIDLIENGIKPSRHILMDTELVIRDSCGAKQKMVMQQ